MSITAQRSKGDITLYPRLGYNISKYSKQIPVQSENETSKLTESKFKSGYTLGAELHKQITERTGASIGLLYSVEGSKFADHTIETEKTKWEIKDFSSQLHYLQLPIVATIDMVRWQNASVSFNFGVQIGYLLKGESKNTIEVYNKNGNTWVPDNERSGKASGTNTDVYKRTNISIPIGFSYEYNKFSLNLRYNIGLTKVYNYIDKNICNRNLVLTIGYGITL
ncbi:hypothetical protein JCM15124A_16870 [Prevotella falsenii]